MAVPQANLRQMQFMAGPTNDSVLPASDALVDRLPRHAVLIVTKDPARLSPFARKTQLVDKADRALERWAAEQYEAMLCDVGQLADGHKGFRIAAAVRDYGNQLPFYLMANQVTQPVRQWAMRSGVIDLVRRHHSSITPFIEREPEGVARDVSGEHEAKVRELKDLLRHYNGPVASTVVDEIDTAMAGCPKGRVPLEVMARAVEEYVEDGVARARLTADAGCVA